jgi:Xaa-Pro aminopeptidase
MELRPIARLHESWLEAPGFSLAADFPAEEYAERVERARRWMREGDLDALVITSSAVGRWFTSLTEPHEWHDQCGPRAAWYVLTPDRDVLYMTPTAGGEHFMTTRRMTWVSEIRGIAERTFRRDRVEMWALEQLPLALEDLGLRGARVGFELGDCMTLGLSYLDLARLKETMQVFRLVDGSPVIRRLMSVLTRWEIETLGRACRAADWIHARVPEHLRPGMTEREFLDCLAERFAEQFAAPFHYSPVGAWDVRNAGEPGSTNAFHAVVTDRPFRRGDVVMRGYSGVSYQGYVADTDRVWAIGEPTREVRDLYRMTWECNRAMAAAIQPGATCRDVYLAGARTETRHGYPERAAGRTGHGLRNTGSLSVHPDNWTELEVGMVISVEPMFPTVHGFFDLEDQYVVTEAGADCLHGAAPEELPVIHA